MYEPGEAKRINRPADARTQNMQRALINQPNGALSRASTAENAAMLERSSLFGGYNKIGNQQSRAAIFDLLNEPAERKLAFDEAISAAQLNSQRNDIFNRLKPGQAVELRISDPALAGPTRSWIGTPLSGLWRPQSHPSIEAIAKPGQLPDRLSATGDSYVVRIEKPADIHNQVCSPVEKITTKFEITDTEGKPVPLEIDPRSLNHNEKADNGEDDKAKDDAYFAPYVEKPEAKPPPASVNPSAAPKSPDDNLPINRSLGT